MSGPKTPSAGPGAPFSALNPFSKQEVSPASGGGTLARLEQVNVSI
jgi:hypothetical protein